MGDFAVGRFNGVGSVADVTAGLDTEVSADGSRSGSKRVGGTEHRTSLFDDIETFPDHGEDGARGHVLDQCGEERLLLQVLVVDFEVSLSRGNQLGGNELVSALLEALGDLSDETTTDTIRLNSDEGTLSVGHL